MIYVSYGVPKSASTFVYVVIETVLRVAGYSPVALSDAAKGGKSRLNYVDPVSWPAIERAKAETGERSAVIKTHGAPDQHLLDAIERGELFASAIMRDPRDIALSLLDHARRSRGLGVGDFAEIETVADTFKVLDEQDGRLKKWMRSDKVLLFTFDEIAFDTRSAVARIIDQIGASVAPDSVIAALPGTADIEQFNKGVSNRYESEMPAATQQILLERYADFYRRYFVAEAIRKARKSGQGAASAEPARTGHPATAAAAADALLPQLVRALYRVLLFREPDPGGFEAYVSRIRAGRPIEDIMRQLLKSEEFAGKHTRFLEAYVTPALQAPAPPSRAEPPPATAVPDRRPPIPSPEPRH